MSKRSLLVPVESTVTPPTKRMKPTCSKMNTLTNVAQNVLNPRPIQCKRVLQIKAEEKEGVPPTKILSWDDRVDKMLTENPMLKRCFDITHEMKSEFKTSSMETSRISTEMLRDAVIGRVKMVSNSLLTMKNESSKRTSFHLNQVGMTRSSLERQHSEHVYHLNSMTNPLEIEQNVINQLKCVREESFVLKSLIDHVTAEFRIRQRMYSQLLNELKATRAILKSGCTIKGKVPK
jgi:hypothetical protein